MGVQERRLHRVLGIRPRPEEAEAVPEDPLRVLLEETACAGLDVPSRRRVRSGAMATSFSPEFRSFHRRQRAQTWAITRTGIRRRRRTIRPPPASHGQAATQHGGHMAPQTPATEARSPRSHASGAPAPRSPLGSACFRRGFLRGGPGGSRGLCGPRSPSGPPPSGARLPRPRAMTAMAAFRPRKAIRDESVAAAAAPALPERPLVLG